MISYLALCLALAAVGIALRAAWIASHTRMNRAVIEMQRRTEEFASTLETLAVEVKRARMREHARQMTKDRVAKRAAEKDQDEAPDPYREPEKWKSWMSRQMTRRPANGSDDE